MSSEWRPDPPQHGRVETQLAGGATINIRMIEHDRGWGGYYAQQRSFDRCTGYGDSAMTRPRAHLFGATAISVVAGPGTHWSDAARTQLESHMWHVVWLVQRM